MVTTLYDTYTYSAAQAGRRQGENRDQFLIRLELHGKSKWLSLYHGAKMIDYHSFFFTTSSSRNKKDCLNRGTFV